MAGTLRPSMDLLQSNREANYIIHNYRLYDGAENLFNGGMNTISSAPFKGTVDRTGSNFTYWFEPFHYLDIEFLSDVKIWDAGYVTTTHLNPLNIFSNENGIKGSLVGQLKKYTKTYSATNPNWEEVATLKKGRYRFEMVVAGGYRISNEWYLEDVGAVNKTLIYHDGEYKKFIQEPTPSRNDGGLIPILTSNTSSSLGEAVASSFFSNTRGSTPPYKAFDNTLLADSGFDAWTTASGSTGWIGFKFKNGIIVNSYEIFPLNFIAEINRSPKSWTFEGSNDGGNTWTVLDTQTNITSWEINKGKRHSFVNKKKYIYYRLNVSENNGNVYLSIGLLKIYGDNLNYWKTVSSTLPTSTQFLSEGMDSLSPLLDRRVETLDQQPMEDKTSILLGSESVGKVFSKTVDLKKYMDIRNMKVEVK